MYRVSPSKNIGTNQEELYTPKSTPKKLGGDGGDKKKKLELDRVFFENEAKQKVDIMFRELLKFKPMFVGKIVKTLGIWHLLYCNFLDYD